MLRHDRRYFKLYASNCTTMRDNYPSLLASAFFLPLPQPPVPLSSFNIARVEHVHVTHAEPCSTAARNWRMCSAGGLLTARLISLCEFSSFLSSRSFLYLFLPFLILFSRPLSSLSRVFLFTDRSIPSALLRLASDGFNQLEIRKMNF